MREMTGRRRARPGSLRFRPPPARSDLIRLLLSHSGTARRTRGTRNAASLARPQRRKGGDRTRPLGAPQRWFGRPCAVRRDSCFCETNPNGSQQLTVFQQVTKFATCRYNETNPNDPRIARMVNGLEHRPTLRPSITQRLLSATTRFCETNPNRKIKSRICNGLQNEPLEKMRNEPKCLEVEVWRYKT